MLNALLGLPGAAAPQEPSILSLRMLERQRARFQQQFEREPQVRQSLDYFRKNIGSIKTVDDLLKDRRLLEFSLSAFQLESQIDMRGFLRKILTEDPQDTSSLAARMRDPRFKQFAQAFSFLKDGKDILSDSRIVQTIEDAWRINAFEKKQGEKNPALREALYFKRMIGGITNAYQILANPALSSVVRTSLSLPVQFAALDVDQQYARLNARLDVANFRDPAWVNKFVDRFLINYDLNGGPPAQGSPGLLEVAVGGRLNLSV